MDAANRRCRTAQWDAVTYGDGMFVAVASSGLTASDDVDRWRPDLEHVFRR